ncbi:thymidylate synthase [Gammaproteobacteria bacterium]
MQNYLDLLRNILECGITKKDRTGIGTKSIFSGQLRFDLSKGFPLVTTKKINIKAVINELLWFLRGETNTKTLHSKIWDAWADENGDLGPIYGKQWRAWQSASGTIDQIEEAIRLIKTDPNSRRILVSAWNVGDLDKMALPPCHILFQFYVANQMLSCQVYQRSADMFIGVPFNIASYSLLTSIIAKQSNLNVGELIWVGGDCHIYLNHVEQILEQMARKPFPLPELVIHRIPNKVEEHTPEDFEFKNYQFYPAIAGEVAV